MELFSKHAYPNELQASKTLNISRYYIRESLSKKIKVKNALGEPCAFSLFYFDMDPEKVLQEYT